MKRTRFVFALIACVWLASCSWGGVRERCYSLEVNEEKARKLVLEFLTALGGAKDAWRVRLVRDGCGYFAIGTAYGSPPDSDVFLKISDAGEVSIDRDYY